MCVRFIYLVVQCDPYYNAAEIPWPQNHKKKNGTRKRASTTFHEKLAFDVDGNFRFPSTIDQARFRSGAEIVRMSQI